MLLNHKIHKTIMFQYANESHATSVYYVRKQKLNVGEILICIFVYAGILNKSKI